MPTPLQRRRAPGASCLSPQILRSTAPSREHLQKPGARLLYIRRERYPRIDYDLRNNSRRRRNRPSGSRQITAQLLRILRTSPTGRKRQPTAAGKTLYKQLRSLGLSRHIIVDEITWDLMNSICNEAYLKRLRNSKLQNSSATRALPPSTLDVFLANLMFDHPDEIDSLLNSSNKVVKSTTIEHLTDYLLPLTVLVKMKEL